MLKNHPLKLFGLLTMFVAGCSSRDARLEELSRWSVEQQARQNRQAARQSEETAKATKALVEADAAARKEMIAAHRQLQSELHGERASLNQQREGLDQERREIAAQRHNDPIIASALLTIGAWLTALLPLLLAAYALSRVWTTVPDDAMAEVLIEQLSSPRLVEMKQESIESPGVHFTGLPGNDPEPTGIKPAV